MAFWSSQTIESRLANLVTPASSSAIDCNAITLTVGLEVYITPSLEGHANYSHTKKQLLADEAFAIPPGQFAFLLTDEVITVPADAMAFISMKASFKLRGLVNVSGFHVDPGWSGRLIFAVFNAGPSPVHLQRGLPLFLIWYADLDHSSDRKKSEKGKDHIPPAMINNITGSLDSLYALDTRLREAEKRTSEEAKKQSDRIHDLEKTQRATNASLAVLLAIGVGILIAQFRAQPAPQPIVISPGPATSGQPSPALEPKFPAATPPPPASPTPK